MILRQLADTLSNASSSVQQMMPYQPAPSQVRQAHWKAPAFHSPDAEATAAMETAIEKAAQHMKRIFPELWHAGIGATDNATPKTPDNIVSRQERDAYILPGHHKHHHRKIYRVTPKPHGASGSASLHGTAHGDPVFRIGLDGEPVQVGWRKPDGMVEMFGQKQHKPERNKPGSSAGEVQSPARAHPIFRKADNGAFHRSGWRDLSPVEKAQQQLDNPQPRTFAGPLHNILLVAPGVAEALGGDINDPRLQSRIIDIIQKKGIEPFATDFGSFAQNAPLKWDFRFDYGSHTPSGLHEEARRDMMTFRNDLARYIVNNNNDPGKEPLVIDSGTTYILVSDIPEGAIGQASPGAAYMYVSFNYLENGVIAHEMGHRYGLEHDEERGGVMYSQVSGHKGLRYTEKNKQDMVSPLAQALGYDPQTGEQLPGPSHSRW